MKKSANHVPARTIAITALDQARACHRNIIVLGELLRDFKPDECLNVSTVSGTGYIILSEAEKLRGFLEVLKNYCVQKGRI